MKGGVKMSQTDKGVLVFEEWFRAMDMLSANDYKKLMHAVYRYQLCGEEPPQFKGKASIVSEMIFPYISRRLVQARCGKKGSAVRYGAYGINPIIDEILDKRANREPDRDADS